MAAVNIPFSYAQAARGQTARAASQTSSSKVTSGTQSPANGTFSELTPGSNWADDMESSVTNKAVGSPNPQGESNTSSQSQDTVVELAKSENKITNRSPNISSPDLTASSSTTTKEDDSSMTINASSSDSTSETKSPASEPAWIAERKERQSSVQPDDTPSKSDKKSTEPDPPTEPKPAVLQDAPAPTVNPWLKRAEEAKAKLATVSRPTVTTSTSDAPSAKENQRPRSESRRKANSVSTIPKELLPSSVDELRRPNGSQGKRVNDGRNNISRPNSKPVTNDFQSDSAHATPSSATPTERENEPSSSFALPSVKDEVSWPTPESTQDKERKDAFDKDVDEKQDEEATPTMKRKKPEWKPMPVVAGYLYDTPQIEMRGNRPRGLPNGERNNRGTNGSRGRGGHRGTSNAINGGDRQTSRSNSTPNNQNSTMPHALESSSNTANGNTTGPPPRWNRASSVSLRGEQKESLPDRNLRAQSLTEQTTSNSSAQDTPKTMLWDSNFAKPFAPSRRNESPRKMQVPGAEFKDDEIVPRPIPRRTSSGTQTTEAAEGTENTAREGPPIRMVPSETRKQPRNFDSTRDPAWAPPRASKRGARGRGGNGTREIANGHPAGYSYSNGYLADYNLAQSPYGVPPSPGYQSSRGNQHFTYAQQGRGGWRTNPRSQSIPLEQLYLQRFGGPYGGAQPQVASLQTHGHNIYDPYNYPMSAMPYQPQMDAQFALGMINTQLDYYFSIDNLLKDMHLRRNMDSQGFVFLDIIMNFRRIKQLTENKDLIKDVCLNSKVIEICVGEDGKERLRRREGWDQFLLPMDQREESAQNRGPERLERPERPAQVVMNNTPPQYQGPASAGLPHMHQRFDRSSYDSSYPTANGYPAQYAAYGGYPDAMYSEAMNGGETRGRAAKSPIHENIASPTEQPLASAVESNEAEPDSFPDDQASVLTVVVRMSEQRVPYHSVASRTFSNGSIDSRSILNEMQKPSTPSPQPQTNGESLTNGTESRSLSRHVSPNKPQTPSTGRASPSASMNVFWVKDQEGPVEELPADLTSEPYVQLRHKALDQRNQAATGTCPYDLDILYQFWSHFLIRNFNNRMYSEFKYFANEDAKERHNFTGLKNMVSFYSQSLSSQHPIRDRIVKDYVELVKNEPAKLEGAAFKQLRSAWRNGALNLKNRKKLADIVDDALKETLDKHEP